MDLDGVLETSREPLEGLLGASWGQLAGPGAFLGPLLSLLGGLAEEGRDKRRRGAVLGPSWGSLRAILGPSWGHLGALLGPSWAILGHLRRSWASSWRNRRAWKKHQKHEENPSF